MEEAIELKLLIAKANFSENEDQAIRLRLQGLEGSGLAEALGTTEEAARGRVHQALLKIRRLI